jgi:hypothetical protein
MPQPERATGQLICRHSSFGCALLSQGPVGLAMLWLRSKIGWSDAVCPAAAGGWRLEGCVGITQTG